MIRTDHYAKFDKSWNYLEDYTEYQVRAIFSSSSDFEENEECFAVRLYHQEESDLEGFNSETMTVGFGVPYYDQENNIAIKPLVVREKEPE